MDRVLIIRNEGSGPSRAYALFIEEEDPVYFFDVREAADYVKERIEQGETVK